MKQHHPLTIIIAKIFAALVRVLLRSRYKISIKGSEALKSNAPLLILPNHQALIDPIILFSHIYRYTTAIPVLTSGFYDIPLLKTIFSNWGAVRVSNLETGSRNIKVLDEISHSVSKGFKMGKNIVLYPSGQIAGQGHERILNKKSAHKIVMEMPESVRVVGVRMTGLWGSMWSKAWMGKSPNFLFSLLKGFFYVLANFILFLPKRKVTIEFEDITIGAKQYAAKGKKPFNSYLEDFYNIHGEEFPLFLRHYFYSPGLKRKLHEV